MISVIVCAAYGFIATYVIDKYNNESKMLQDAIAIWLCLERHFDRSTDDVQMWDYMGN